MPPDQVSDSATRSASRFTAGSTLLGEHLRQVLDHLGLRAESCSLGVERVQAAQQHAAHPSPRPSPRTVAGGTVLTAVERLVPCQELQW